MRAAVKTFLAFFIYSGLLLSVHSSVSREDNDDTKSIYSQRFSDISRPSGKMKSIVSRSSTDDGRSQTAASNPAIIITQIEDDIETTYEPDEEEEKYTEPSYEPAPFEMLTNMREIKPFFFKDFIEITAQNCSHLTQLSKKYKVAFEMYMKGLWVKEWKTSLGFDPLLDLLYGFRDIAALKLDLVYDKEIVTAKPIKRALQYYKNLNTLELNNSHLNDEEMKIILDSLHYAKAPLKFLILKGNALSTSIGDAIKGYFPSLTVLQNVAKQSLFASVAFEIIAADSQKMLVFLSSPTPFDPTLTDKEGNTLLHLWGQSLRAQEEEDFYLPKILNLWKEKNGDLNALNQANLSLFDLALQNSHWVLIEALLKQNAGKRYYEQSLEVFYHHTRNNNNWKDSSLQNLFKTRKLNDPHFAWVLQRSRMLLPMGPGVEGEILTYNQGRIQREKRYLPKEVSDQLWDDKGAFKAIHVNGHRMVGRVIAKEQQRKSNAELETKVHTNRIYFKRYPAFPGVSIAISLLQDILFGEGFLPLTFAKIKDEPFLLSPGIGRIMWDEKSKEWVEIDNLHYILTRTPERLKELDPAGLQRKQLMDMLTNPEDGKPSNYGLQRRVNKGALLYGLDEEQGFVPAAAKLPEGLSKFTDLIVQMKSNLMCFDNMGDEFLLLLQPIIKEWRPRAELERWIRILIDYQGYMVGRKATKEKAAMKGLFSNNKEALFKEKETYLDIPFQQGQAGALLKKLEALKRHVLDNSQTTIMDLLYILEPFAAQRYVPVLTTLKDKSIFERFMILDKPIYKQNQPLKLTNFRASREEFPSSLRSTHLLKARNIPLYQDRREALQKGVTFDAAMAFRELTEALVDVRAEALIKMEKMLKKDKEQAEIIGRVLKSAHIEKIPHLNFKDFNAYEQQLILTAMEPLKLIELGLKNSSEVNVKFLSKLNLKGLEILELNGCLNINDDILPLLEALSPTLKILDLSFNPNLKHVAHREGTVFINYTSLKLPSLETLALKECTSLETLLLNAPKLTTLKLKGCRSLKPFTIDARLLHMIDARNSPWLTDSILDGWISKYPQLNLLKLEGNPQLLVPEIREQMPQLTTSIMKECDINTATLKQGRLNLSNSGIPVEALERWIVENALFKSLKELNHSGNSIGDKGTEAIAQYLTNLNSLDLNNNSIGAAGAEAMAQHLTNLKSLALRSNCIGDKGAEAIAQHLTALTSLDLYNNGIGEKGTDVIAKCLTALNSLDLYNNGIGEEGRKALMRLTIPPLAKGYEEIYKRFLEGVLIYRPKEGSDVGRINMPIAALANPYEGTFDLSQCGDARKYLSIATGYRKGKLAVIADKSEIWIAPRFLIERELQTTASHFQCIMRTWSDRVPVGIFWTWGGWDELTWYDYLTTEDSVELSNSNLYNKYLAAHRPDPIAPPFPLPQIPSATSIYMHKFYVHFMK